MQKKLFWAVVLIGVFGVFYLSWLPQPKLGLYWFMPKWLASWVDSQANDNLRTAVPFLFLGIVVGLRLAKTNKPFSKWVMAWGLNVLIVTIAELGQLFISNRSCDLGDIMWGGIGAFVGLVLVGATKIRITVNKRTRPQFGL